ncbi:MAG: hypothetical protein IT260_12510 [Saprospiraceae bacterium]|nr:hypothetical protein [Saprospiraceae bacterium]
MRTKQSLITVLFVLGCFVAMNAQSTYKAAIGLRLGYPTCVSFKYFLSDPGAIEAFAGFRGYGSYGYATVGAAYEHHFPIGSIEGFTWYVGGGAAVQFWNYDFDNDLASTSIGILGVGGVDYKFASIPLNLSADVMPTFFIGDNYYAGYGNFQGLGALSARYTFK